MILPRIYTIQHFKDNFGMGEDHNRHMKELQEFLRVGVTIFLVEVNLLGIVENLKDV